MALTDPGLLRSLLDSAATSTVQLRPLTPQAVQMQLATLADAVTMLRSSLDAVGYDIAKLPPDLVVKLQGPVVADALARLESYAKKC